MAKELLMLKKFRSIFVLLLVSVFSTPLMANEWANYYFPDTLGSSWTYQDQDGDEFTRYAIEPQDVDGETYRAFSYEPPLEDWKDYRYHIHSYFYQIGDDWVAFSTGEEIENAMKALVTDTLNKGVMQPLREQLDNAAPLALPLRLVRPLKAEAQDYFYLFPTPITYNEEWNSMAVQGKFVIRIDVAGDPNEVPPGGALIFTFNYNVSEIGTVKTTETVETPAGTFEDSLKIEFQTEMGMTLETSPPMEELQSMLPEKFKIVDDPLVSTKRRDR